MLAKAKKEITVQRPFTGPGSSFELRNWILPFGYQLKKRKHAKVARKARKISHSEGDND